MTVEIAWAAGFFDGEGSTSLDKSKPRVAIGQKDRQVLDRFKTAVGYGKVYGPYVYVNPPRTFFYYVVRRQQAEDVIACLWPFLSQIKREQATAVFGTMSGK